MIAGKKALTPGPYGHLKFAFSPLKMIEGR